MNERVETTQAASSTAAAPAAARPATEPRPAVIALRKSCDADGTGLSHYVLMDRQVKA